jgi:Mn2+/Fe2+ NRAMP family transporter
MTGINRNKESASFQGILKALGPGILYAGAAIGASHLVQATRAGASYGFSLIWVVVLINLFKYPFFEFGYRYTAATGESMLEGYRKLGRWVIVVFFLLMACTGMVNVAAIIIVTAGLASCFFNIQINLPFFSALLLGVILMILFLGKYALLDRIMKIMLTILAFLTVMTFAIAAFNSSAPESGFIAPSVWNQASIAFLIALMGWMPTPIEASVFPSLWALERKNQTRYTPKFREALADFHIGYVGSAVMAIFFLGLGAFVMYGSGQTFSDATIPFSQQIVSIYAKTLGRWSYPVISAIAMLTMFSTALTVIDAYPRTLEASAKQIFSKTGHNPLKRYWFWVFLLSGSAMLVIGLLTSSMKKLLDFATIVSFLAAPAFAFLNYKVVTSRHMPGNLYPKKWLLILAKLGMAFLCGFSLLFMASKIFPLF